MGKEELSQINALIEQARPLIFNFSYPITDMDYKPILERKIIKYYFFREICDIPVGKWQIFLDNKMNEIMPYYDQLYKSATLKINPLYTVNLNRNYNRKNDTINETTGNRNLLENANANSTSTTDSTTDSTVHNTTVGTDNRTIDNTRTNNETLKMSDTPQGDLTGVIGTNYLTQAQQNERTDTDKGNDTTTHNTGVDGTSKDTISGKTINEAISTSKNEETNTNNSKSNSLEDYIESITGTQGRSESDLLNEFRSTLLNIDKMVINDLNELFFGIY